MSLTIRPKFSTVRDTVSRKVAANKVINLPVYPDNALAVPSEGTLLFNSTDLQVYYGNGIEWLALGAAGSTGLFDPADPIYYGTDTYAPDLELGTVKLGPHINTNNLPGQVTVGGYVNDASPPLDAAASNLAYAALVIGTACGANTGADNSITIGNAVGSGDGVTTDSGLQSISIGYQMPNYSSLSVCIGQNCSTPGDGEINQAIGFGCGGATGTSHCIMIGNTCQASWNCNVNQMIGDTIFAATGTTTSVMLGSFINAEGEGAETNILIGRTIRNATGSETSNNAIVIGATCGINNASQSISVGFDLSGDGATGCINIGNGSSVVQQTNSIAIGRVILGDNAGAAAENNIAICTANSSMSFVGSENIAIGNAITYTSVGCVGTIAIGSGVSISGVTVDNSIVIGYGSNLDNVDHAIVLGSLAGVTGSDRAMAVTINANSLETSATPTADAYIRLWVNGDPYRLLLQAEP